MATKDKITGPMTLNEQAQAILRIAEQHGVEQNFFFITTFKRYQVQINLLNDCEKTMAEEGTTVTKQYVKGRSNVYSHPSVAQYIKLSMVANQTVATLIKIIETLRDKGEDDNELMNFITRGRTRGQT